MTAPISVGILEDDSEFRDFIATLVTADPRTSLLWTASTSAEAIDRSLEQHPRVILVDLGLPDLTGDRFILTIKERLPNTDYLVISVFEDYDRIYRALCAGASGYLAKSYLDEQLVDQIVDLSNGGSPMSSPIARKVVNTFTARASEPNGLDGLTRREQDIVHQLALGKSYQEIADDVLLSVETVRSHIRNIYRKLEVHSRAEIMKMMKR